MATLNYAIPSGILNLDTHLDSQLATAIIFPHIYDGLTWRKTNIDPAVSPQLAESFRAVNDTTWEFKLRKGVKFHNGEEFNAEVVKFNIERQQDVNFKPRYITDYADIKVEIVDPYTARMVTKAPDPILPNKLIQSRIVPMKYIKDNGNAIMLTKPVGAGPFKFIEHVVDERLVVERFDDYWGGKAKVKKMTFSLIPQSNSRVAALKTGAADIAFGISPDEAKSLEGMPDMGVSANVGTSGVWIAISLFDKSSPVQDKRVRQAISYAVNTKEMIDKLLGGYANLAPSALQPAYFGNDATLQPYPYDPKKARELLAAAGYPDGFEIIFDFVTGGGYVPREKEFSEAVAGYLAQVGIKTKMVPHLVTEDFANKEFAAKTGPRGLWYFSRGSIIWDADVTTYQNLYSTSPRNWFYYSNKEVDDLLDKGRSTLNQEERKKTYAKALGIIKDDAPWFSGFQTKDIFGYNKKKVDFKAEWGKWVPTGYLVSAV
ncbi:MAG: hypothetical protein HYU86_03905 [Chloroflexi bacterium]|nr:hypothetical protein [Chloroflexota bacterium]